MNNLKFQIEIILYIIKKIFKLEKLYILTVLFLFLFIFQNFRLKAIFELKFKNIEILLIYNSKNFNKFSKFVTRFNLAYTKIYLEFKAIYILIFINL